MAASQETRFLYGGIDSDTAIQLIDDKSLLNAVNVRAVISKNQQAGDVQFIEGNTFISNIGGNSGFYKLIGKCTDDEEQVEYLFLCSQSAIIKPHAIYKYDKKTNTVSIFFGNGNVSGGLGFTPGMYISARVAGDLLIWATDGSRGVSYLNTKTNYSSPPIFITPEELSLITEPPHIPLEVERDTDLAITTNIQFTPLQFAYRFINTDNFSSVLSPDSLTLLPVRSSDIITNGAAFGNVSNISVDFDQKIPRNWKTIEFIVRYIYGNTFFVIKQFNRDNPVDAAAIAAHNSGITQLSYNSWSGGTVYAIDAATAAKQFDNIPINTKLVELGDNRLFLANNTNGYTTPIVLPSYSIALTAYQTTVPTSATNTAYFIFGLTGTEGVNPATGGKTFLCYYAIIIRIGTLNYLLPRSFASGSFYIDDNDAQHDPAFDVICKDLPAAWNLPDNIARDTLIELKEQGNPSLTQYDTNSSIAFDRRRAILQEANNITPSWSGSSASPSTNFYLATYLDFELIESPDEFGSSGQSRTFLPNGYYKIGIQYYDAALRKSGDLYLESIYIPAYGPFTRTLTEFMDFTLVNPSSGAIPLWAIYYSITLSKNQKSIRIINFVSNIIKVAVRNAEGEIKYGGNGYLTVPPSSYQIYGLAIPIQSTYQYGYGYAFNEGDYVELIGFEPLSADTSVISGSVLNVLDGFVIIRYDATKLSELDRIVCDASEKYSFTYDVITNTGTVIVNNATLRQNTVLATLYNQTNADAELYEIAKFGLINNPGTLATFGNFFDSGSLTTSIFGDMYTQPRVAEAGAFTGYAITTYEVNNLFPVNDTGRVTLIDTIGQKYIPTEIRWSNTNTPGTSTNGYASFDASDYKLVEQTTGEITFIIRTTKGIQEGAQMVILCSNGSYTTLIGKQQIYSANQESAFVQQTTEVLGTVNEIRGGWGCSSPRSVVEYQGRVWWVDIYHQKVIEFNAAGAGVISDFKARRLWRELSERITADIDISFVTASLNPYYSEVIFFVPATNAAPKTPLPTVPALEDPLDCYYNQPISYIYNWEDNRWKGDWQNKNEMFNIGNDVYSVVNAGFDGQPTRLYHEFVGTDGNYFGVDQNAMITIPFNGQYPMVKSPLSIRLSCSRPPDETWIVATDGNAEQVSSLVTVTGSLWKMREGDGMAAIGRNRLSNNASMSTEWNSQNIRGWRLKGKTIQAVLIWYPSNGSFTVTSATLEYNVASGHH